MHWHIQLQFWETGEAATESSSRFLPPKSYKDEVSLLSRLKPKSSQYKDKWAVHVSRNWQAAREKELTASFPRAMQGVSSKMMFSV